MNPQQRITQTREGVERRGAVRLGSLELEGDSYLYLLGGAVVSLLAWVALQRAGLPWLLRTGAAALPLAASLAWIRWMVAGRPPAFREDVIETLLEGRDFWVAPRRFDRWVHPLWISRTRERGEQRGNS